MLAFVMVFTGMGIGSWGVDTAWADENQPFSAIVVTKGSASYEFIPNFSNYTAVCTTGNIPDKIIAGVISLKGNDSDRASLLTKNTGIWTNVKTTSKTVKVSIDEESKDFTLSFEQAPNYFNQITYNYCGPDTLAYVTYEENKDAYVPTDKPREWV